jgi:PilZ domain
MSSAPGVARVAGLLEGSRVDARAHRRYLMRLDVEYKVLIKGRVARLGSGKTLNVSSGGVCFECMDTLPIESSIELVMNWPCLLAGVCRLTLVMRGRIVRNDGQRIAVQVKRHEFRTAGTRASRVPPATVGGRSVVGGKLGSMPK